MTTGSTLKLDVHSTSEEPSLPAFLVTGGPNGIGGAIAPQLSHPGARIILTDKETSRGLEAAAQISAGGSYVRF